MVASHALGNVVHLHVVLRRSQHGSVQQIGGKTNFTDLPLDLSLWRVFMAQVQCLVAASTQQLLLQLMYQA